MSVSGVILAAPGSGSGKTTLTLALLRAAKRRGLAVASAKAGPDFIDPAFHTVAGGRCCLNLDSWAMRPETLAAALTALSAEAETVLCEGVMGLFDGAGAQGHGSTAELAATLGWPVVMVIDAAGQGASAAVTLKGFATHDPQIQVAGVIYNRVGGAGHGELLARATAEIAPGIAVVGAMPRDAALDLPARHLGLVQAREHPALDAFLDHAADLVDRHLDLDALLRLAAPSRLQPGAPAWPMQPLGSAVSVACDDAFAFAYPGMLDGWRAQGASVHPFSPLADEGPDAAADAVYLPGGYPELHAERLADNREFMAGLRQAADRGAVIYGECGGYMVMGEGLVDATGTGHAMAGLLPVETSFASSALHLGYRDLALIADGPLGPAGRRYRAHEFHKSCLLREGSAEPLFQVCTVDGEPAGTAGLRRSNVAGSYMHVIDRA